MTAEDHVRRWLTANQTGCGFATLLAKAKGGIAMGTFPAIATTAAIDRLFEYAAAERRPAIAVLPGVRTEPELVEQLLVLAAGQRWRVCLVPVPSSLTTTDVFVSLEWLTLTSDQWSSPMGLAPLGTMPGTRRSPYTCIAAWPGARANRFRTKIDPSERLVHFLDVDLSKHRTINQETYDERRKAAVKATREILFDDSANNYRNVAFRLSAAAAERLAALRST